MNIPNEEHLEAAQNTQNKILTERYNKMSEEQRAIFLEISEFSQKLAKANIRHMFYLDASQEEETVELVRYNHMHSKEYKDKFSPESLNAIDYFFQGFCHTLRNEIERSGQACSFLFLDKKGCLEMNSKNFHPIYSAIHKEEL